MGLPPGRPTLRTIGAQQISCAIEPWATGPTRKILPSIGTKRGASIAAGPPLPYLLSTFENVSVFLKAPQVSLEQVKRSLGIPRIDARSPQADYAAFLLLYDAPPLGDEFLGAAQIIFGIHLSK
jgi:hypothetical protein